MLARLKLIWAAVRGRAISQGTGSFLSAQLAARCAEITELKQQRANLEQHLADAIEKNVQYTRQLSALRTTINRYDDDIEALRNTARTILAS